VNLFDGVLVAGFNALALKVPELDEPLPLPEGIDLPVDSDASLAVRPEKMRLSMARPDGFTIAATVEGVNYQGGLSIVHLATASGLALKVQMASAAAAYQRGMTVWASWDPVDAVVLSR
jgi:ABC-type Fe3+/spermidine/putrescine transport system ATPase subunit